MEGFLTFILILVLSFYLVGWLGRVLLRRWIMRKQEEMAGRFTEGGYQTGQRSGRKSRREGEVTIQTKNTPAKKVNREVGEYVEYEEEVEEK